jgi:Ca-activated chloride channel family protein
MKRANFLVLILLLLALAGCGQSPERLLAQGNEAFESQSYDEAWGHYDAAQQAEPGWTKAIYNAANTRYRQGVFDQAQQLLQQVVGLATEELAQQGFFNLGNSFFQVDQWDTAVEAYKNALRLDPDDQEAKYNLELALEQLQEQQNQQQQEQNQEQENQDQQEQNQDQQDQDQQNQSEENQDQEQNQDQQNQDQQNQSEENQDQQGQENQDQEQQEQEQNQGQPGQNQPPEPAEADQSGGSQPQLTEGLTEEQARQLFSSVGQSTETLQEKLQQVLVVPAAPPAKDW